MVQATLLVPALKIYLPASLAVKYGCVTTDFYPTVLVKVVDPTYRLVYSFLFFFRSLILYLKEIEINLRLTIGNICES